MEAPAKDERNLMAMRLLEGNPTMSQRELAEELGVSLGATNYCLKALVERGWIKLENFQKNPNKLGYLYLLTPRGVKAKARLTSEFLQSKLTEYERLKEQIASLIDEVERAGVSPHARPEHPKSQKKRID